MQLPTAPESGPRPPSEIAGLWRFFKRYRGGILLVVVAAALLGTLVALSLPPVYRATVTLLIEPRTQRVVQVQDVYDPSQGGSGEYFATQYELLRSRDIASRVVDKLKLAENEAFLADTTNESVLDSVSKIMDWQLWLPGLPQQNLSQVATPDQKRERAVAMVQSQTTIQPVPRTRLVRVHFLSSQPALAQQVATALADVFIESGLESRLEATQRAGKWLTVKLADLSAQLQRAEKALQNFRDQNQLVVVGSNRGLVDQDVMQNSQRLRDAQQVKMGLANTYAKISAAGSDANQLQKISALLQDSGVQKAKVGLLDAEQVLKAVEERYGRKHPQMAASLASVQSAQRTFREQLLIAADGLKNQYELAAETERQASSSLVTTTERIRQLDRKQYDQGVLEREVQSNKQLYDLFLQRFKETDSTASFEPLNARVTDSALLPKSPIQPNRLQIVVFSAFIGFLIGILLASLRHVLSEGLHSVEDLEAAVQVPLFGVVPTTARVGSAHVIGQFRKDIRTPFAEGVRSILTAIRLAEVAGRKQCVVITSALPGEGKSSVAACLGLAMAASEKTLLLEMDLRAPSLRKPLGLPKQQVGIMEALTGSATLEEAIFVDAVSGLHVMGVRQRPPNPSEIVGSAAFIALLAQLKLRYDRIIIDSPPCLAASDALVLARQSDAVLFVARADVTTAAAVRRAVHQLRTIGAPLIGCVFNRVDVKRNRDIYGHYQYAYRYYGK